MTRRRQPRRELSIGMVLAANALVILGAYLLVAGASNLVTCIYGALAALYWLAYVGWRR